MRKIRQRPPSGAETILPAWGMEPSLASRVESHRSAIGARWTELLRAAPSPAVTGTIVPLEMLVFLVDDTLGRLLTHVVQLDCAEDRQRRNLAGFSPTPLGCRCGLHQLLAYYLAGLRALRECLPANWGTDRLEVVHCFNRMAHDEMAALCSVCRHRQNPDCGFHSHFAPNLPHEP